MTQSVPPIQNLEDYNKDRIKDSIKTWFSPTRISEGNSSPVKISLIFPLFERRGNTLGFLESWANQQSLPRHLYEVLVISDDSDRKLDQRLRNALQPGDRLIVESGADRARMINIGSEEGRGELLFFTESHCAGNPRCLEKILEYLRDHDVDAACVSSQDGCLSTFAKVEGERFNQLFEEWSKPDSWRKVMIRGFLIPKSLYWQVGGFDERYSKFAEWAYAAELFEEGYRIGCAEDSIVTHFYTPDFPSFYTFTKKYAYEECAYRHEKGEEFCLRYFGEREDWNDREIYRQSFSKHICQDIRQCLQGPHSEIDEKGRQTLEEEFKHYSPKARWGIRGKMLRLKMRTWYSAFQCWRWKNNEEKLRPAYVEAYSSIEAYHRLRFISEILAEAYEALDANTEIDAASWQDRQLLGFHAPELLKGRPFRWTRPASMMLLNPPADDYVLHIDVGQILGKAQHQIQGIYFNGFPVHQKLFKKGHHLIVRIRKKHFAADQPQKLTLLCKALPADDSPDDARKLGIPIFSLFFEPKAIYEKRKKMTGSVQHETDLPS